MSARASGRRLRPSPRTRPRLRPRGAAAWAATLWVAVAVAACGSTSPASPSGSSTLGSPASTAGVPTSGTPPSPSGGGRPSLELTIFAAASLKTALEPVAAAYEGAHPGVDLVASTDSSAALETQIEEGAPADVFLSADVEHAQNLVDRGLADGPAVPFAGNRLVVIVPADNPARIGTPADLARPGVKIVAAGDAVPISAYATHLVERLAALPGYPADFAARCAANVVSREDNVRAVLAKVELGEGDAAIVYATDALASTKVATIAVPDAANVVATYAGAVVGSSGHRAEARAFLDWLSGPAGRAILAGLGFTAPGP